MNGPKPSCGAITLAAVMLVGLVAATAGSAGAQTTWHVPDDPGAATIAEALASAVAGDTIVVAPGTYFEHDLAMTEGVLLRSELNDAQSVIVDAAGLGRVMTGTDLTGATEISSITLTGGPATGGDPDGLGGAVYLLRSSPALNDCRFVDNSADYGGAFYLRDHSDPVVVGCTFAGNASASAGRGSSAPARSMKSW